MINENNIDIEININNKNICYGVTFKTSKTDKLITQLLKKGFKKIKDSERSFLFPFHSLEVMKENFKKLGYSYIIKNFDEKEKVIIWK